MEYELYLRNEVFAFLRQCRRTDREALLTFLRAIADDPHRRGDFTERDRSDRDLEVLVFRGYAVVYWADHPVKELKVVDIRYADR